MDMELCIELWIGQSINLIDTNIEKVRHHPIIKSRIFCFRRSTNKTSIIQNKINGLSNNNIGNFNNTTPELLKEVCGIYSPILRKNWNNDIITLKHLPENQNIIINR